MAIPPVPPGPAVDVVIPAQRAGSPLRRQLAALVDQDAPPTFGVTVVLAGPDDEGWSVVEQFRGRLDVRAVDAPMSGAGAARNAGAREGTAPVILFCDADDRVGRAWVRRMAEAVERADLVGGPIVVDRIGTPSWVLPFYLDFESSTLQSFWGQIPYVISASLGVRRAVFESVGGFDLTFRSAGGEEVDLCMRLDRPIEIVTDPEAAVLYTPRTTVRGVTRQRTGYAHGAARLTIKHDLAWVGEVASIDWMLVLRALRSPRRVLVAAASFAALRWDLYRLRRSAAADSGSGDRHR